MDTPELDKVKAVADQSQTCGEFYEWLIYEKNYVLAHYEGDSLTPARPGGVQALLAEFFDIDLQKMEKEKQAILDEFRNRTSVRTG